MAGKNRVKLKGRLKSYFRVFTYLGILLALVNLAVFTVSITAGLILLVFCCVVIPLLTVCAGQHDIGAILFCCHGLTPLS